jgi:arsenate reductase (glutaredoxin)
MSELTIYEKPTCTTCRKTVALLKERGIDFDRINYYVEPLSEEKLRDLLRKGGLGPRDILRTKEPVYRELGLARSGHSDDDLIRLMVEHPDLVQRPIAERGDRAVLARPPERITEILD